MNTTPPFPPELWEQTPIAVREYIHTLEARVAALEATVQRLLERLQQDSHNSSRPPSSDPPQALRQRPRRGPSGRKRGGQPGHQGQSRAVVPIEEVDAVVPVKPRHCHRCQHPLQGEDPQPSRHQVTEVPPMKPVVTEYQMHR
jgi:transposase